MAFIRGSAVSTNLQLSCSCLSAPPNTAPQRTSLWRQSTTAPRQIAPGLAWWDPSQCAHALRAVKQFAWLEVGSGKVALSRPTHLRPTQAVGRFLANHR
jgi:hypothetical protein